MPEYTDLEPGDFHVAVKRREHPHARWRWEIWAAGRTKATEQSEQYFATMSEASKAGKAALLSLLKKRFQDSPNTLADFGRKHKSRGTA